MKNLAKKILPSFLFTALRSFIRYVRLLNNYIYDCNVYFKGSMNKTNFQREKLISLIIMDTHVIEKGLTMTNMRYNFGIPRVKQLVKNIDYFIKNYNKNEIQILHAVEVLNEYVNIHITNSVSIENDITIPVKEISNFLNINSTSIQKKLTNFNLDFKNQNFEQFCKNRFTLRKFGSSRISIEDISKAIDLAKTSPSACNRQSVRVHCFSSKEKIKQILEVQAGARGFGENCDKLLIVTFDSKSYFEEKERNLGYVDGGIFAMNLLYSLQYYKIGNCILNASNDIRKDKKIRSIINIAFSEIIVCYVACGAIPSDAKIAYSKRYEVEHYLKIH